MPVVLVSRNVYRRKETKATKQRTKHSVYPPELLALLFLPFIDRREIVSYCCLDQESLIGQIPA